jgi:hypothetical protein
MVHVLDVEAEIDRLFQTGLTSFIAERNALASRLKAAGDSAAAQTIKALAKPSPAAWAANQLYWRSRKQFDDLLGAVERARNLQAAALRGRDTPALRAALDTSERALERAAGTAAAYLDEAGHRSQPLRQRLVNTLRAIAAQGRSPSAPRAGHLATDLAPPGFSTLAALTASLPAPPLVAVPARSATADAPSGRETRRSRLEELGTQIRAAERARREGRKRLTKAEATAARAEAAAREAAGGVDEAERELAAARAALSRAETTWNRARTELAMARAACTRAAETLERLQRKLEELQGAGRGSS